MKDSRKKLVNMAFDVIDRDVSGILDLSDVISIYDVSKHPDFLSKKKSKEKIIQEFLNNFVVNGSQDGFITKEMFQDYYENISASIDSDEYFELMIRNAWHISGGVGAAANSSNMRVLVTRGDGSQVVQEVQNDLGLRAGDKQGIKSRLQSQGIDAMDIAGYGTAGDQKTGFQTAPARNGLTRPWVSASINNALKNNNNRNGNTEIYSSNHGNQNNNMTNDKPKLMAQANLISSAKEGSSRLDVKLPPGILKGMHVVIGDAVRMEVREIIGFGSILINKPLQYSHPVGSTIRIFSGGPIEITYNTNEKSPPVFVKSNTLPTSLSSFVPVSLSDKEITHPLLDDLKLKLTSRGARGLVGLQRYFRIIDDDESRSLNISEFKKALKEVGVVLKRDSDGDLLFRLFGKLMYAKKNVILSRILC